MLNNMKKEQWDELPVGAKIVGRRTSVAKGHRSDAFGMQDLVNASGNVAKVTWKKGVFRFKTYEEADAWWISHMMIKK